MNTDINKYTHIYKSIAKQSEKHLFYTRNIYFST